MKQELFQPSFETEARLLLIVALFGGATRYVEGRTKLAKIDFLLRYPNFLARILRARKELEIANLDPNFEDSDNIESRMVRYRYGPWDPAHYATLGRLIGKGLITYSRSGYQATEQGHRIAKQIVTEPIWKPTANRLTLMKKHLNLSGKSLKDMIYEFVPEVARAEWGDPV